MRWGIWGARSEERGLGHLTLEAFRHLQPDRTAVIDMGNLARGFTQRFDLYPGATIVPFGAGVIDEAVMASWFDGLDVALIYETAYDHRAYDVARRVGCRTICDVMPEFHRHLSEQLPHPDVTWAPTTWRFDTLPAGTRLVPVPVALDRFPPAGPRRPGPMRVLHVAGHRALADRNGTLVVLQALRMIGRPVEVRIVTQDRRLPTVRGVRRHVRVTTELGGTADYWDLYRDADVLVLPRRYGGLCLPALEGMAAGLAVVMTDCPPQDTTWPTIGIESRPGATITTPGGEITMADPAPAHLAQIIDGLADDPEWLADQRRRSLDWAQANSWAELEPLYRAELAAATRG